jgi:hypothetical protein
LGAVYCCVLCSRASPSTQTALPCQGLGTGQTPRCPSVACACWPQQAGLPRGPPSSGWAPAPRGRSGGGRGTGERGGAAGAGGRGRGREGGQGGEYVACGACWLRAWRRALALAIRATSHDTQTFHTPADSAQQPARCTDDARSTQHADPGPGRSRSRSARTQKRTVSLCAQRGSHSSKKEKNRARGGSERYRPPSSHLPRFSLFRCQRWQAAGWWLIERDKLRNAWPSAAELGVWCLALTTCRAAPPAPAPVPRPPPDRQPKHATSQEAYTHAGQPWLIPLASRVWPPARTAGSHT